MNVVRSTRSLHGLGDLVDSPIFQDIQTPQTTVDDFPMYNDPGLTEAENVSAIQAAQGATSLVPSAGSAIASAIPSAVSNLTRGLTPGPSPRIAIPLLPSSAVNTLNSVPTWVWSVLIGGAVILSLSGGRRR